MDARTQVIYHCGVLLSELGELGGGLARHVARVGLAVNPLQDAVDSCDAELTALRSLAHDAELKKLCAQIDQLLSEIVSAAAPSDWDYKAYAGSPSFRGLRATAAELYSATGNWCNEFIAGSHSVVLPDETAGLSARRRVLVDILSEFAGRDLSWVGLDTGFFSELKMHPEDLQEFVSALEAELGIRGGAIRVDRFVPPSGCRTRWGAFWHRLAKGWRPPRGGHPEPTLRRLLEAAGVDATAPETTET